MFNMESTQVLATIELEQILAFVIPLALFFVIIYFFIVKPEKRRRAQVMEMQSQLKINDKIITIGGIHGIIEELCDDTVTIIIAGGGKMKLEKTAVRAIIND